MIEEIDDIQKIKMRMDITALQYRAAEMKKQIAEIEKEIHHLQKTLSLQTQKLLPGQIQISAPITAISRGGIKIITKTKKEPKKSTAKNIDLSFDIPGIVI